MKNTMSKALWGVFFVLLGISLAGRAVGVFDFNLYFPGWWTLFIIVPSAIGLVSSENRKASLFGFGIGIILLISVQGIVDWNTFPRLIIALIFISIGWSFLFRKDGRAGQDDFDSNSNDYNQNRNSQDSNSGPSSYASQDSSNGQNTSPNHNSNQAYGNNFNDSNYNRTNHGGYNHYTGFFSGRNVQFVDEEFTGADVTSILGNVQLDLRNAILKDDVVIETTCILGGVDVYVPNNAKVVLNCTPILGGVENKVITPYNSSGNTHTIFIRGTCILGGIEVK
ncbi:MAG: LiaF domain-containing protein [Anaerocolumna sp.]